MKKIKIFISHEEKSYEAALLIKKDSIYPCEIIYIEDFVKNSAYNTISEDDIIHFSCNSALVYKVLEEIRSVNCFVFNKKFLMKKYNKKALQLKFKSIGINIPKIYNDLENIEYPVFCKENIHTGVVFQICTKKALECIISKIDTKLFYYEESLIKKGKLSIENKYYYSNGKICAKNGKFVPKEIRNISAKIKNNIDIDIYSMDIIYYEGKYFLIDFNPSVGFYLTNSGRKGFLNMTKHIFRRIK